MSKPQHQLAVLKPTAPFPSDSYIVYQRIGVELHRPMETYSPYSVASTLCKDVTREKAGDETGRLPPVLAK
jgi:hypothetical protein